MKQKFYKSLFFLIIVLAIFTRTFKLGTNPPGLYWEEVALGYDAYSIWQTGRDHHGNLLPIVAFESFGDYKPSLYFYTDAPFVGLLGLNAWSVRLPSVICGILIVLGIGQLAKLILQNKSKYSQDMIQLIGMAVAAINPWATHFSRGAWEANLASCLTLWGVIFGLRFIQKKQLKPLFFSVLTLILSMYAYHSTRVIAPILGMSIVLLSFRKKESLFKYIKKNRQNLSYLALMAVCLVTPILVSLNQASISHRFTETSIFSDLSIIEQSNSLKEISGNGLLAKIYYHRYVLFAREITQNFFDHFNLDFLFISGDANPRHSIQYFGHLYYFELPLLLFGIYWLGTHKKRSSWLLPIWLIIGILPAALTKTTPHALRILPVMPIFLLVITLGIYHLITSLKKFRLALIMVIVCAYAIGLGWYADYYFKVYPIKAAQEWQSDYPTLIKQINDLQAEYPENYIYVSRDLGRPAMYYWFYTQTDPREVQAQNSLVKKDQGEFLEFNLLKFDSSRFSEDGKIRTKVGEKAGELYE